MPVRVAERRCTITMAKVVIYYAFSAYSLGLIVYVVCSWIKHERAVTTRAWLAKWYDPFLIPLRRELGRVMKNNAGLDLSPIVLLVIINLLRWFVIRLLIMPS